MSQKYDIYLKPYNIWILGYKFVSITLTALWGMLDPRYGRERGVKSERGGELFGKSGIFKDMSCVDFTSNLSGDLPCVFGYIIWFLCASAPKL